MKFSIIIPNYNHGHYLTQCIESAALQDSPPDEILVLDDASSDSSEEVLTRCAREFSSVRHWRHSQNRGLGATLQELFAAATGDFILPVAADDSLLPGLMTQARDAAHRYSSAGMILARQINVPESWNGADSIPDGCPISDWTIQGFVPGSDFLASTLTQPKGLMAYGICAFYRKSCVHPHELAVAQLHHLQDVFPRLCAGTRAGVYFLDCIGHAFRVVESSLSRSRSPDDWKKALFELYRLLSVPEYQPLFGSEYPEQYLLRIFQSLGIRPEDGQKMKQDYFRNLPPVT